MAITARVISVPLPSQREHVTVPLPPQRGQWLDIGENRRPRGSGVQGRGGGPRPAAGRKAVSDTLYRRFQFVQNFFRESESLQLGTL